MNQNYNNHEYEIKDAGIIDDQPRYPLAQAPSAEVQQMSYKGWMDRCTNEESEALFTDITVKDAVTIATSITAAVLGISFPLSAATASIVSVLIPYWWPAAAGTPGSTQAQITWERLMSAVEKLSNQKIQDSKRSDAISRWKGIQALGREYARALCDLKEEPDNAALKTTVRNKFESVEDQLKISMPYFSAEGFEIPMLSMYAQAANMHLLLLKDVVQNGVSWGYRQIDVDRYYSNTDPFLGNPGLLQLSATYTDYCVQWYNTGLRQQYAINSNNWNVFNAFRRNMTIMVLDIVSLWPTYDPKRYSLPTKSQLTRTVYTDLLGFSGHDAYPQIGIERAELELVQRPGLFTWLRELNFNLKSQSLINFVAGIEMDFDYTTVSEGYKEKEGSLGQTRETVVLPSKYSQDDIWKITTSLNLNQIPNANAVKGWIFSFTKSPDQLVSWGPAESDGDKVHSGLACNGPSVDSCDLCIIDSPCRSITPNNSFPCDDKGVYSHRFSYLGAGFTPDVSALSFFSYGWTHVSVDANNLINTGNITQIPAVKGSFSEGTVIRGPGSTGGDLVQLFPSQLLHLRVTIPADPLTGYRIRIRYASKVPAEIAVGFQSSLGEPDATYQVPATYTSGDLTYNTFGYQNTLSIPPHSEEELIYVIVNTVNSIDSEPVIIDKIEFIPIEESVAEFEANQGIEKARKAVNALFTDDAKNALKLNITDYAVDQAANLVNCLSEDFHAQEKMILLDQAKFAKRLSQVRNLLNYGDFESPDWSGENGWKTSPHVHVSSDNPIFKGRYLHMPGANQPQMSDTIYPTYIYQKVDESRLKSYTCYHVRGFVGNSKDLELLVERYGKEVHVEMDVPNDIRYTLPMNECGGFDRCGHSSYQAGTDSHTCTCKDTARMDAECQCKDKSKRIASGVYTNAYAGSDRMYPDGHHAHRSCGCNKKGGYQNGKHAHKSCGCKDPHVFSFHIDTGCVDMEENLGLLFALKIASTNGVANIDNLELIEGQPLTGEALARVKKREHKWKEEMKQKRCQTEEAVQATKTAIDALFTNKQYNRLKFETLFLHILHADELVQRIPYVYHPF
ncbi:insecticidal delta-endotoxin Cry8Ea1 family protein, partial [Bacillus toyonensis]